MNTVQNHDPGITRDRTYRSGGMGGMPASALTSSSRLDTNSRWRRIEDWQHAIDEVLGWKSSCDRFDPEDQPDDAVLETAIDYAVDQREEEDGAPAPDSIMPSGSGRIAMEWNDGPVTVIIEFIQRGVAQYTRLTRGKVETRETLIRNPESRQLELRG